MQNSPASMDVKMQALKANYLKQLQERKERLEQLLVLCERNGFESESRAELQQQAHKLAGTGATYGFPAISATGKALEEALIDHPGAEAAHFIALLQALLAACASALQEPLKAAPTFGKAPIAEAAAKPTTLPTLLVVDDDEAIRTMMQEFFKDDARVITGVNASEAIELMQDYKPDLVLLDDMMPGGVSGLRLLEDRQSMPEIQDIPVIMITTSDRPEEVMRGLMGGAVDYITKPFNPEEIATKIRKRLRRQNGAILIADDDEAVRELLKHKFQMAGYKVVCVADGNAAWAMMLKQEFALVILDRMMPGHDGMTLLRMMKDSSALMSIPVVFLTARHYGSDVLEGLHKGAADYIIKPFNPDEVIARCDKLLKAKGTTA